MPEITPFTTQTPRIDHSHDRRRMADLLRREFGQSQPGQLAVVLSVELFEEILTLLEK